MKHKLTSLIVGSLSGIALCLAPMKARADPPTAFTLEWSGTTDRGVWSWSRNGTTWTVVYPSGARRLFREQKRSTVKGATGTIIENISGARVFVFIPDWSEVQKRSIYYWTDNGPWGYAGLMQNVEPRSIPHGID